MYKFTTDLLENGLLFCWKAKLIFFGPSQILLAVNYEDQNVFPYSKLYIVYPCALMNSVLSDGYLLSNMAWI